MKYTVDLTIQNIHEEILRVPSTTGIYVYKSSDEIIYIGKAVNLKARLLSHEQNAKQDAKESLIIEKADTIELIYTDSEFKALVLEASMISNYKPKYNIRWRDDKSYLYVKITTKDEYPKVLVSRKEDDGVSRYFGPFDSMKSVESLLKHIRQIVPYCAQANMHKQACFYHKIGLCDPCPNKIQSLPDEELTREKRMYRNHIRTIVRILEGKTELVFNVFQRELRSLTKGRLYEKAIKLRDGMRHLELLIRRGNLFDTQVSGSNRSEQSVVSLMTLLKPHFPELTSLHRMECYDNSTLSFEHSTASMVVFTDGKVDKQQYRRFAIKADLDNDFDMLKEVIVRRSHHAAWGKPDLIIIDGGKPQLDAIRKLPITNFQLSIEADKDDSLSTSNHTKVTLNKQTLDLRTVPLIGIAKNPDRLVIGIEGYPTIRPVRHDLGFRLVQYMRDEAHRFAKKYHTYLRSKIGAGTIAPKL